jgi:hypothetical protein
MTPGVGDCDPEHRFPMVAALDHLQTSVNRQGTSKLVDIGCERERCFDCVLGSIKDVREGGKVLIGSASADSRNP